MRQEAFGEIGLLPDQFYRMRYTDYILMQRGFANKRIYDQAVLRKAVSIVIAPWLKNSVSASSFWPLPFDDQAGAAQRALETLRRMKEKDGTVYYVLEGGKIIEVINPKDN